jgi:hypothetical protein
VGAGRGGMRHIGPLVRSPLCSAAEACAYVAARRATSLPGGK